MKHALVLFSSPHKDGHTKKLLEAFLDGLKGKDWQVKSLDICKVNIHPCIACGYCQKADGCAFRDLDEFDRDLRACDLLLIATPVYNLSFPAQLKAVIDRFYANNEALMGKKKAVFLTAMADEDQKTASGANASFDLMADYLGWEIVGRLNVGGCSTADDLHEEDLTAAYELGRNL